MPRMRINFEDTFKSQRALAAQALQKASELREMLDRLLPGEDPETGTLHADILEGQRHISEIQALIRDQWFRNRQA